MCKETASQYIINSCIALLFLYIWFSSFNIFCFALSLHPELFHLYLFTVSLCTMLHFHLYCVVSLCILFLFHYI